MKKSTKILLSILIFLSIVLVALGVKTIEKEKVKVSTLKKVNYLTTYKDFSQLTALDSAYSYSSLIKHSNTKFMHLVAQGNTTASSNIRQLHDSNRGNNGSTTLNTYGNGRYRNDSQFIGKNNEDFIFFISNCAFDANGNSLDVLIYLNNIKSFSTEGISQANFNRNIDPDYEYEFNIYNKNPIERNQNKPIARYHEWEWDLIPGRTADYVDAGYNTPIVFELGAKSAIVQFNMVYYIHPSGSDNETPVVKKSGSNYELYRKNGTTKYQKASITKVNGLYSDIDQKGYKETGDPSKATLFTRNRNSITRYSELKSEGLKPYNTSDSLSTIYYNKNKNAYFYEGTDYKLYTKVTLAEDNGGIKVWDFNRNQDEDSNKQTYDIEGPWYGTAAFMTNTISDSTLRFSYSGDGCGMDYCFTSPCGYNISTPTKTQSKNKITRGDVVEYKIKQYIPNMYSSYQLNYNQVYGSNFNNTNKITLFRMYDKLDENLVLSGNAKILAGNQDVTYKFTNNSSGKTLDYSLKSNYMSDTTTYNDVYTLVIPVKLANNIYASEDKAVREKYTSKIENKGWTKVNTKEAYTNTVTMDVYYNLQGNVWRENGIVNGRKDQSDVNARGVLVVLWNTDTKKVDKITRTDANGNYTFTNIIGANRYSVIFYYNEQLFQSTYWKRDLTGGYSTAREYDTTLNPELTNFKQRFANINSYPNNYAKVDLYNHRIENVTNQNYGTNGEKQIVWGINQIVKDLETNKVYMYNGYPLTFDRILNDFDNVELSESEIAEETNEFNNNYNSIFYNKLKATIKSKYGISEYTANAIINYLKDCISRSVLWCEDGEDMRVSINGIGDDGKKNHVDFGMYLRPITDIAVENNVSGITYSFNGFNYYIEGQQSSVKTDSVYQLADGDLEKKRKTQGKYNSNTPQIIKVSKADYLYNASDYGEDNRKNLNMQVTYESIVRNNGNSYVKANDLNIWYEESTYEPGAIASIYDKNNQKIGEVQIVKTNEALKGYKKLKVTNLNAELAPKDEVKVLITYEVKKNKLSNGNERLVIEGILGKEQSTDSIGKKNIAELASYSTFYKKGVMSIPEKLDSNNNRIDKDYPDKMQLGTVDINSNPGNLNESDLREDGRLNYDGYTIENDVDQAICLKVMAAESSKIKGTVFEDLRTNKLDNNAVIGNGTLDNDDPKIDGVTVELVELTRNIETGLIDGEKVWSSYKYDENLNLVAQEDEYYSGKGKSRIVVNGTGLLETTETNLNKGEFMFDGIPTGSYVVRFKYGDTVRTVLDNTTNEVNTLLNLKGMNSKSYNGQDYKSTIYQSTTEKVNGKKFEIKNTYFNGNQINEEFYNNNNFINGYNDYQQYTANKNEYVKNSLSKLYYYDNEHVSENDSDAKDIYYYRLRSDDYSKNLINKNSEVLNSYRQLAQVKSDEDQVQKQKNEINELVNNTSMVAQTGVMSVSISEEDMNNINFGLQERPKSQIILNQEVSNVKVVLANGRVEFDASQSLKNLYYGQHKECGYSYRNNQLVQPTLTGNSKQTPELIQVYMDKEIMDGSHLVATYKIKAKNIGEVDYKDKLFYYTGVENNQNDNLAKVKINKIINYTSNNMKYDDNTDVNKDNSWKVKNADELYVENGKEKALVNAVYKDTLKTYDTLLITEKGENKYLQPILTTSDADNSELEIELELNTSMGTSLFQKGNLTYNNLTELVEVTSENGRKLNYSVLGNQDMADQSLGANSKPELYTNYDLVTPKEVDADSSQKINILPPTGENKNYLPIVISVIISSILVIIAAIIIKKKVIDK